MTEILEGKVLTSITSNFKVKKVWEAKVKKDEQIECLRFSSEIYLLVEVIY